MARTKNRGYQQTLAPTYTARLWKMGGYIRLSREDLQKINRGLDDSNSVKNQRDILNDFHFNHAEEFESYTEYVDDGHTGTDTERESFQRLLGDVMSGKINCVVVKDLSRFARNYSDAGSLIDNLSQWPAYGILGIPLNTRPLYIAIDRCEQFSIPLDICLLLLMCEVHYTIPSVWIQDMGIRPPDSLSYFFDFGL